MDWELGLEKKVNDPDRSLAGGLGSKELVGLRYGCPVVAELATLEVVGGPTSK